MSTKQVSVASEHSERDVEARVILADQVAGHHGWSIVLVAVQLAHDLHGCQRRKVSLVPDVAYEAHLWEVASLMMSCGGDETLVAAALLHDAVEDQGQSARARILEELGSDVLALVESCTEVGANGQDTKDPWYVRKGAYLQHIAEASLPVLLLLLADKLQSARELIRTLKWVLTHEGPDAQMEIWSRFRGGQVGTLWFHRRLVEELQCRLHQLQQEDSFHPLLPGCESLLDELVAAVEVLLKIAQEGSASTIPQSAGISEPYAAGREHQS